MCAHCTYCGNLLNIKSPAGLIFKKSQTFPPTSPCVLCCCVFVWTCLRPLVLLDWNSSRSSSVTTSDKLSRFYLNKYFLWCHQTISITIGTMSDECFKCFKEEVLMVFNDKVLSQIIKDLSFSVVNKDLVIGGSRSRSRLQVTCLKIFRVARSRKGKSWGKSLNSVLQTYRLKVFRF